MLNNSLNKQESFSIVFPFYNLWFKVFPYRTMNLCLYSLITIVLTKGKIMLKVYFNNTVKTHFNNSYCFW